MPNFFESCEECFGSRDLYQILKVQRDAKDKDLKKAYYKLSLAVHPDRASEDKKAHATRCFQVLGKIMAVLSDKEKRTIYDETGAVSEDDDEGIGWEDRDWTAYWRLLFKPVSKRDIEKFFDEYRGSEKEKEDLLLCYKQTKGDWNKIWEMHMCYHGVEDEPRLLEMMKQLVAEGKAEAYDSFFKEPKSKRDRRHKRLEKEAKEARKELANRENQTDDLAMMIAANAQKRLRQMDDLADQLAAKYGRTEGKGAKRSKKKK